MKVVRAMGGRVRLHVGASEHKARCVAGEGRGGCSLYVFVIREHSQFYSIMEA